MSILSPAEKIAITAGLPTRQTWSIYVPRSSGSSTFDAVTIHDDDGGPRCVQKAGRYVVEGFNVSMQRPGRLSTGLYRFVVDNSDSAFSPEAATNHWYNSTGSYQAYPVECHVEHKLYVLAAGSWSTLVSYRGIVQDVQYDEHKREATIEARALAAVGLERKFTVDDAVEEDTGVNEVI